VASQQYLHSVTTSDFGIVLTYFVVYETYFIVYEAYFIICGFCRNIRVVSIYFVVYASLGVIGHASADPFGE
jgi:hypothetical protein